VKGPEMVNISIIQKARQANDRYNDYVNQGLDSGEGWDYSTLDELREMADKADAELLAARDEKLNECTCSDDPNREWEVCPSCIVQSKWRYGDHIPFGGE